MGDEAADAPRIGILGGTFDPPHRGHVAIAVAVADAFGLDRVLFVPAGSPWQKDGYSDPEDRYLMTVLATDRDGRFEVSRAEIDRSGPTYTVDTIETIRASAPDAGLFLILGADAAANLFTWVGLDRLRELVTVIAVNRPGTDLGSIRPSDELPAIEILEIDGIDVSATAIRAEVAAGRAAADVEPEVAAYIAERRLYREEPDAQA